MPLSLRRRLPALLLVAASVAATTVAAAETAVVAGADGRTGRLIVRELLAGGYQVRALVRAAGPAGSAFPPAVEVVVADARQPATLAAPLAGAAALVISIGGRRGEPGNGPEQVDYQGVANLAAAAATARLGRVVLISSAGVTRDDHPLNARFDNVLRRKAQGEQALRAAGVTYTIIRPGGLTDADPGPGGVRLEQGDRGTGFVPRADVARIVVAALRAPAAANRTFEAYAAGGAAPTDWNRLFGALAADPTPGENPDVR